MTAKPRKASSPQSSGKRANVPAPASAPLSATSTAAEVETAENPGTDTVIVCLNRAQGIRFTLKDGQTVEVAGNAVHLRGRELGVLPPGGAFGMTSVPRAAWEEIEAAYKDTALFKSGRIFAQCSRASALAQARERGETRHGLEPVTCRHTQEGSAAEA